MAKLPEGSEHAVVGGGGGVVETFIIAWLSGATIAAIYKLGVEKE